MSCPECQEQMEWQIHENQIILHCNNCGANFFEENGINRISFSTAKKLHASRRPSSLTSLKIPAVPQSPSSPRYCPKDASRLEEIHNEETIPPGTHLYRCGTCRGLFISAQDLLRFKKAQKIKIDFFKIWSLPLPPLQTVLVISFMLFISFSLFATMIALKHKPSTSLQASEIIKDISITSSDSRDILLISFRTTQPMRSRIVFYDNATNQTFIKKVNAIPRKRHLLSTKTINLKHNIYYQIILTDDHEKEVVSPQMKIAN